MESNEAIQARGKTTRIEELKNKDWLYQKYIVEEMTGEQIGELLNCTKHPVLKAIKKHGLPTRKRQSAIVQLRDKEWLRSKYVDEQMSLPQLSALLGTSVGNVHSALKWAGIPTRDYKEGLRTRFPDGRTGAETSNWRGGISVVSNQIRTSTKYSEWHRAVLARDHYMCVFCGDKKDLEVDHKIPFAQILRDNNIRSVEDASNSLELWDINNGQSLCHSCHVQTDTHSCRLEPIDLDNDKRSDIEKKIDALENSKSYYQKRNWQLQRRVVPELKSKIKQLESQLLENRIMPVTHER